MGNQTEPIIPEQLARIIEIYNSMNTVGQKKLFEYAEDLNINTKYGKKMIPFPHVSKG